MKSRTHRQAAGDQALAALPRLGAWSVFRGREYGITRVHNQDAAPLHTHDFDELVIITSGAGVHLIDHEEYPLIRGDVFVVRGEHAHTFRNVDNLCLVNVLFRRDKLAQIEQQCRDVPGFHALFVLEPQFRLSRGFSARMRLSAAQLNYVMQLIDILQAEYCINTPGSAQALDAIVKLVVLTICRFYSAAETGDCHALVRISKVLRHLEDHYAETMSVTAMARMAGMPIRTFRRAFRQAAGCPPHTFVIRLRLEQAARMLTQGDHNITRVAFDVGFENSSYFTRQFRKMMGTTPRAYVARRRTLQP